MPIFSNSGGSTARARSPSPTSPVPILHIWSTTTAARTRPSPRLRPSELRAPPLRSSPSAATKASCPTSSLRRGPSRRRLRLPRGCVVLWRLLADLPDHRSASPPSPVRRRPHPDVSPPLASSPAEPSPSSAPLQPGGPICTTPRRPDSPIAGGAESPPPASTSPAPCSALF
uniref:Uncharacterized protein n=1 Tax=Arundo donax TaxID=35708 RepID=A0A0A9EB58_ARUDO